MNRRQFLTTSAAATAVTAAGPILLGAQDKAGSKLPRVGAGEHTYECHHNWGQLPNGLEWQTTHNVAVDSQGQVYVTHQGIGKKQIDTTFVFDPEGKFVRSFGKQWHGGGHGIEIRKEGSDEFIYLSNTWTPTMKLVKTTLKGEVVWQKGRPEAKEYEPRPDAKNPKKSVTPAYNPTNICFLPDGGFNVGDGYGSHFMLNYDRDGNLVKVFGGTGDKLGQLRTPHGQWVDDRDEKHPVLLVCDRANARLQTFTLDGKPIMATEPREVVLFPAHAKTRGKVVLLPDLHARVSLLDADDRDYKPIVHLGEDKEWREKVVGSLGKKGVPPVRTQPKEWLPGKFVHPHDACFDKDGNIYVVEWVSTGRITFLKKVG